MHQVWPHPKLSGRARPIRPYVMVCSGVFRFRRSLWVKLSSSKKTNKKKTTSHLSQKYPSVQQKAWHHVTSYARLPSTPSPARVCRDSNYRVMGEAVCLKVRTHTDSSIFAKIGSNLWIYIFTSTVEFPCGRLPDASVCHHRNCPWQVRCSQPITWAEN